MAKTLSIKGVTFESVTICLRAGSLEKKVDSYYELACRGIITYVDTDGKEVSLPLVAVEKVDWPTNNAGVAALVAYATQKLADLAPVVV